MRHLVMWFIAFTQFKKILKGKIQTHVFILIAGWNITNKSSLENIFLKYLIFLKMYLFENNEKFSTLIFYLLENIKMSKNKIIVVTVEKYHIYEI